MKRNIQLGVRSFGLGLFGLVLSLNAQAAAVTIDAINISPTLTAQSPVSAIIDYIITPNPNAGFVLSQGPVVTFGPSTDNIKTINIDLYFVPSGPAPATTEALAAANSVTADLGTLLAGAYDITATSYFQNNISSSISTSMKIPPVPIPAAIWLMLSAIAPLVLIGRRKSRA